LDGKIKENKSNLRETAEFYLGNPQALTRHCPDRIAPGYSTTQKMDLPIYPLNQKFYQIANKKMIKITYF